MTKQERITVTGALGKLALLLGLDVSGEREKAYLIVLDDLPAASVLDAISVYGRTATYSKFPLPGELRELVEGSATDAAAKAWIKLQNAYRKAGASMSVLFEDGAIGAAMQDVFGGWIACCEVFHPVYRTADEATWEERQEARLERREAAGRQIHIGGLSPEMLRAKQKEFDVAYRRVQREGKTAPTYYPGECEIENRRTVGSWVKGQPIELDDGRKVLVQKVYVQGNEGRSVDAEFDFYTAALQTPLRELIERAPAKALPPQPATRLIGTGAEMIDLEEGKTMVKGAVADLMAVMKMPFTSLTVLSEEEFNARQEQLRRQAAELEPTGSGDAAAILREQFIKEQGSNLASELVSEEPFPGDLPEAFQN